MKRELVAGLMTGLMTIFFLGLIVATVTIPFVIEEPSAGVVKEIPIDARHIESHQEIKTDYDYQLDLLGEETFKLMPNTHTVIVPDKYEVQYRVYYDDHTNKTEWREVARDEYEVVLKVLNKK